MAGTKIRGITIELGGDASGLSKALKDVNKEINGTQKQLKDVERLLKLDPTNTKLLEQRQRLLGQAVGETKTKLDALKRAEKQVQQQMAEGKASQRQYDALQREIIATEQSLQRLEQQAKESQTAMSRIGDAANSISSGANKISNAMAPVTKTLVGLGAAAYATVPATEELRADLSKLDQNAAESGAGVDAAREAWRKLAAQSGETDSAVEAISNLLQAGFTESDLEKAVEGLAGAAQRFPDTLKIEGLADSLQETLASGRAVGQFGELLDRLGIGADNFSERLAACTTQAEKQDLALQTLAKAGLNDSYKAWAQNNQEMLDNREANLKFQESMAELAETVLPAVTVVTEKLAEFVGWFASLDKETQTAIMVMAALVAAISPVAKVVSLASGAVSTISGAIALYTGAATTGTAASTALAGAIGFLTSPIGLTVAAVTALIAIFALFGDETQAVLQRVDDFMQGVFARDWTETFGPVLGGALNLFMEQVKAIWDGIMGVLNGVIDFVRGVFTLDWERAWIGVKEIFASAFGALVNLAKSPINGVIGLLNKAINAVNTLIEGFNGIGFDMPKWLGGGSWHPNIPTIPNIPMLAKGGDLWSGSAIVGEAGPELLTMMGGYARVTPLTSSTTNNSTTYGGVTVNLYGDIGDRATAEEYGRIIGEQAWRAMRAKGVC